MKAFKFINAVLAALILASVARADMVKVKEGVASEQEAFFLRHPVSPDRATLEDILKNLVSEKNSEISNAVDRLVEIKDAKMLIVSLKYPRISIKKKTALALNQIAEKSDLPEIIQALEYEIEMLPQLASNAELDLASKELQLTILAVIRKISKVEYEGTEVYSSEIIKNYLEKVRLEATTPKQIKSVVAQPSDAASQSKKSSLSQQEQGASGSAIVNSNFKWLWILGLSALLSAGLIFFFKRPV